MNNPSRRHLFRALPTLFFAWGCSISIFEIVWFQSLHLIVGSSSISLAVLLGTFVGGVYLGGFLLQRYALKNHSLRTCAVLGIGIGIIGLLIVAALPAISRLYSTYAGIGMRAVLSCVLLLPPTLLMGAAFSAISRSIKSDNEGSPSLGSFYLASLAGAAFGCLLAGAYLLRVHGIVIATYVAASINLLVGLISILLVPAVQLETPPAVRQKIVKTGERVYWVTGVAGFTVLGAGMLWTRQLSSVLGPMVYSFSIVLAVFLVGIGIGSILGGFLSRKSYALEVVLGLCLLTITVAVAWTAWAIVNFLPYWALDLSTTPLWRSILFDIVRCLPIILPAAILWGASIPLIRTIAVRDTDHALATRTVYAAGTVGAILGVIVCGVFMLPWAGSQQTQRLLVIITLIAAWTMMSRVPKAFRLKIIAILLVVGIGALTVWSVPRVPELLIEYGRSVRRWAPNPPSTLFVGEGLNASVAVTEWPNGVRNFHLGGKIEASTLATDMRLQRLLGHLSASINPQPRSVLIVGFGAGVTAGTFALYPDITRIVICEIEPLIPEIVADYFIEENNDVIRDPRVRVVYDDVRHYLLSTGEQFDIITSDPIHPWVKGGTSLNTEQYFELAKNHLNPGGVISQWVPLYESSEAAVKSEMSTFLKVFPSATLWSNDVGGRSYDIVMIAQNGPPHINLDEMNDRLETVDYDSVRLSLHEVRISSAVSLLSTFVGSGEDLQAWLQDARTNTDRNLRLQYMAGLTASLNDADRMYNTILEYGKFPETLFIGSPALREELQQKVRP